MVCSVTVLGELCGIIQTEHVLQLIKLSLWSFILFLFGSITVHDLFGDATKIWQRANSKNHCLLKYSTGIVIFLYFLTLPIY